jgi:hypothetical protein
VPGKHEPPSKRSFYISLATSTLRAVVLIAVLVAGVVVLANAFDRNESESVTPTPGRTTSVSPTGPDATTTAGVTPPTTTPPPSPPVEGIVVKVLNGTNTTGLAGSTSDTLSQEGYTILEPGNSEVRDQTTLFYRADSEAAAQGLKQRFFPTAVLEIADPAVFGTEANVTVILGADYNPSVG